MNLKIFMGFAAVVAAFFGLSLLFMPDSLIESNGLIASDTARLFARSVGGMLLGVAVMTWLARDDQNSKSFWGIVLGNLVIHVLALITDGAAIMNNVITKNFWLSMVVHGFFIVAFGYIYFRHRNQKLSSPAVS